MCAIHGFGWADEAAGRRMTEAAAHRGPDGSEVWADGRVTLGHNLLAVTDGVAGCAQPWQHASGCVLTFNGEVYNYRELAKRLGLVQKTNSDTEVLAEGLAREGVDFLRRVDGMYALAWYDPKAATLTLARDTNGSRPLYAGFLNGQPAFSSEIRSLLALGFPRVVSKEGFKHYYHAGLVAGPLTMFEGIHRVVPGQVITFRLDVRDTTYQNLCAAPPPYQGFAEDIPQLLRAKLGQACGLTLSGRRQVGLFLSGGLDSNAVLHELAERHHRRPRTFTTRFVLPHPRCRHNEDADTAAAVALAVGTKHRESVVGEQDWVDALEATVLALEEPRQGKSLPAYYLCNKLMSDMGCVVTLSGDGGDELLMGYKHQFHPPFARRLEALRPARELPDPSLALTPPEQVAYLDGWLPAAGLTGDPTNDFMYAEWMHTLAEDFLVRNDKLGAAFGMEARFPLTCNVFRDFCRSLPGRLKRPPAGAAWGLSTKPLLRAAYAGVLPPAVTDKAKTGWRAPTDEWLVGQASHPAKDGPLRQYVRELLREPHVRYLFGITEADVENRYLNNRDFEGPPKTSGKPSVGPGLASQKELFSVIMFAVWFKAFDMRLW